VLKLKLSILFIFLFIVSSNSLALTLNKMQVNSKQDEPLDAVIDVIYSKDDNAANLIPAIASKENYEANGLSRLSIHSDIKIRIEGGADGPKIFLTSEEVVKDPFLDLLIQIDSEKGRVYKEYTVLLEPPSPKISIKEVVEVKNKKQELVGKKDEVIKAKAVPEKNAEQDVNAVKELKKVKKLPEQKKVKSRIAKSEKGKTLYQIARENKPSGVTTEQMVLAIYQNNPKAFSEKNVNTLIKNKKLKIPPVSYFKNHSHLEARKILREQNTEWKKNGKKIKKPKKIIKVNTQDSAKIKKLEKELLETKKKLKDAVNINIASKKSQKSSYLNEKKSTTKISSEDEQALDISEQSILKNKDEAPILEKKGNEELVGKEKIIQEQLNKTGDDVFVSSISDINEDKIDESEIIIENKGLETIHVLLLVLFFILLLGLLIVVSRRKASERNQTLKSFIDEGNPTSGLESSISSQEKMSINEDYDKEVPSQKNKKNYLPIADDD